MMPPEAQPSHSEEHTSTSHLDNLEQLLPQTTELEPHEAELGFEVVEIREGEFGPTVILGREIPDPTALPFRAQDHPDLVFAGGAARAGLAQTLGLPVSEPRDIDILRLTPTAEVPRGWEHTYDAWSDLGNYMQSRDLTVNEALLHWQEDDAGGRLMVYATREAICDTLGSVIAPSLAESRDNTVRSRLAARAIRFAAGEQHAGNPVTLELPPVVGDELWTFDLALQFDRAAETGCVEEYIELVRPYTDLPDSISDPKQVLAWLQDRLADEDNDFAFSLHTINELNPDDDPFDDEAYEQMYALAAKHFRRYNQLARDPQLAAEDLAA